MSAIGRSESGFTLIEMLVVLAIAGLIAGIGFPRLQGMIAAQEWRTGVAAVTALLRAARARAVLSGRKVTVSGAMTPKGVELRTDADAALALPDTVRIAGPAAVVFYGDGSASGGEIAVVAGQRRGRIAIAPATGLLLIGGT